jgi:flagellar hook-length control protein FliK
MSIELSSAPGSLKTVAGAEAQGGKGKVKSGDEADASAETGFFAILTSLEPPAEPSGAVDMSLSADKKPEAAVLPPADPAVALAPNLPTDLAMLLAQAGKVAGGKFSTAANASPVAAKAGIRPTTAAIGADKPDVAMATSAALEPKLAGDFKPKVDGLLDQMAQALPAAPHRAGGAELQAGLAASLAESRGIKQASLSDFVARESALSSALASSGLGDSVLRQADRVTAKSSFSLAGSGVEGIWGQQALGTGSRVDVPAAMADPSVSSPESMVADTVSYWVTQGVQNAQLKLDGFGDKPVEVSISLKGDEAQIDFRTDQPEIRQILEGAVAHLKDLLTREGLVLSGVSVGASGQDSTGSQQPRDRAGAQQAAIVTKDEAPTVSQQRVNNSVGRALDLFV